jgi:hypothetical protein
VSTSLKETPPDAPYGTHPRRSNAPLIVLLAVFTLWFGFLIWLAIRFPAR